MLVSKIKEDMFLAKKNKETAKSTFLSCLYSDCVKIGKDDGNRETLDTEVFAVIKKYLKGIDENLTILKDHSSTTAFTQLNQEKLWLESYLPKQLTETEISKLVEVFLAQNTSANMGQVMSYLKTNFNGQYDGKLASQIINGQLSSK